MDLTTISLTSTIKYKMSFRHHIILFAVLLATWFLLSGYSHTSGLLFGLGLLSCVICQVIYHRVRTETTLNDISLTPLSLVRYNGWLLIEIVKSNFAVIRAIVTGQNISPQIFELETPGLDETGQVIYANSITLTPGTVSMDVTEGKIQVHGILKGAERSFADNRMLTQVRKLVSS